MAIVDELQSRLAGGETLALTLETAFRLLGDPHAVAAEPVDPAIALAALCAEWERFAALARDAWSRYPQYQSSGAHGLRQDPRAIELYGTMSYLERAGMYRPSDLAAMLQRRAAPDSWLTRETVRLRALLVCLARLVNDLDSGAISAFGYADAVHDLAKRFGQATVATP